MQLPLILRVSPIKEDTSLRSDVVACTSGRVPRQLVVCTFLDTLGEESH